jgi:hypothetical protein
MANQDQKTSEKNHKNCTGKVGAAITIGNQRCSPIFWSPRNNELLFRNALT